MGSTGRSEGLPKFVFHLEKGVAFLTSFAIGISVSAKDFSEILTVFIKLAETRLSKKQKQLLLLAHKLLQHEKMTLNSLIEKISKELKMPPSTVKWNVNVLRKAGLLQGGNENNKGLPACLTPGGKLLAQYLQEKTC